MTASLRVSLTQRVLNHNGCSYDSISRAWYTYLSAHRIIPVPNRPDQDFNEIVGSSDLIVFTGGDRHPARDMVERNLMEAAIELDKPVIGICHGLQRLTVMLGGSIVSVDGHQDTGHIVTDTEGSRHWVNSHHRFRIGEVPHGAAVLATDEDGWCESWIKGKLAGVMWHPERPPFDWLPTAIAQILHS